MWDDPQSGGLGSVNASNFGRDHDVSHFGGDHLFMGVYWHPVWGPQSWHILCLCSQSAEIVGFFEGDWFLKTFWWSGWLFRSCYSRPLSDLKKGGASPDTWPRSKDPGEGWGLLELGKYSSEGPLAELLWYPRGGVGSWYGLVIRVLLWIRPEGLALNGHAGGNCVETIARWCSSSVPGSWDWWSEGDIYAQLRWIIGSPVGDI